MAGLTFMVVANLPLLVFECGHCPQNFGSSGPLRDRIIAANLSISKNEDAFSKLRDVLFVRD